MTQVAGSTPSAVLRLRATADVDVDHDETASTSAFDGFVRAAADDLGRVAWVLTLDPDDAADLVQEALARAFARWPRIWASGEDPFPYVRRILVNLRTDRWRRRLTRRSAEQRWISQVPALGSDDPAHAVADHALLARALIGLTDRQRRVVALRYLEDLSVADTAATLGVSQAAVKMAASRALAHLRAHLEGIGE